MNEKTKELIKYIRFPLMLMVVFIHCHFSTLTMGGLVYNYDLQDYPYYSNVAFFISKLLCRVAVPAFFFFSGYLLYSNNIELTKNVYIDKLRKRFKTLFVPYIFWNTLVVAFYFILQTVKPDLISGSNKLIVEYNWVDWFDAYWRPICYQFWFLRDLMVAVLVSPIIYYMARKWGGVFSCILIISWLFNCEFPIVSLEALCFVTLGILFRQRNLDITNAFVSKRRISLLMFLFLMFTNLVLFNMGYQVEKTSITIRLFVLFEFTTIINIVSYCLNKKILKVSKQLHDSNFFIYAYHGLPAAFILKLVVRYFNVNSDIAAIVAYFSTFIILVITGLLLFVILSNTAPKFTGIITGNRYNQH